MKIITVEDYDALSRAAAHFIATTIAAKPDASIIIPTGNTPVGTYRSLAQMQRDGLIDASRLRVFQLDEYLGRGSNDPRSFFHWINTEFMQPLNIPISHVVRLPGEGCDPQVACAAYEAAVRAAGGIDLAVLGLGTNGHLGFNEPPVAIDAPTRTITLTDETINSNAVYWGGADRVPRQAITAGLNVVLSARQTLLLVSGKAKREILEQVVNGSITPNVPGSYLQGVDHVTIIADREAWPQG